METLERLSQRIETIGEIRDLVHTMKTTASVNLRQFQLAQEAMSASLETNLLALQVLAREGAVFPEAETGPQISVVFGAERGFCGRYSDRLAEVIDAPENVITVGTRLAQAIESQGKQAMGRIETPSSVHGITASVATIFDILALSANRLTIQTIFMTRKTGAGLERQSVTVWPIAPISAAETWPSRRAPFSIGAPDALLQTLLQDRRDLLLQSACLESMIAESSARFSAMQAAEENIDDRLGALEQVRRLRRQETITTELMDIWSGYSLV